MTKPTTDLLPAPGRARGTVPLRLLVGVTGHRALAREVTVAVAVRTLLDHLRRVASPGPHTEVVLDVISPLAEGADRLVASVVLEQEGARLHAVLPLPRCEYERDFGSPQSREAFGRLLSSAARVTELAGTGERVAAYERAGRLVTDSCDVLIAVWDGQPTTGRGGTAEIVEYARAAGRPILRVSPDGHGPAPEVIADVCGLPGTLERFDTFNAERVDPAAQQRAESAVLDDLHGAADSARDTSFAARAADGPVPVLARADCLALRYQHRHRRAGAAVPLLAAAAVAAAASQAVFAPDLVALAWVEAACVAVLLGVFALGTRGHWHDRWLDYRRLAERCRTALFVAAAGVHLDPLVPAPRGHGWADDWVDAAYRGVVWSATVRRPGEVRDTASASRWLAGAWLDGQRDYHAAIHRGHSARHRRLFAAGTVLFALTCVAALLHAVPGVHHRASAVLWFAAIVLPACGGAIAAIRTQREYHRTSTRSADLAGRVANLAARMRQAADEETLARLAKEAADTMARENDDWNALVRAHPLEPPA